MATTVKIIIETLQKGDGAKKSAESFTALAKKATMAAAAVIAAGTAVFKMAEQGAAISQTSESFDLLLRKVGAAPALFDELKEASRGTINEFQMQTSFSTLLAGTTGELSTSLANATPRLLEIAKASNKLNPALGSTDFLFGSIARGIKRTSPLILDNLGIVVKVGKANEVYAEQLGKTVQQLTASEKQQALLNAVLEQGGVLIDQVGGDTEAAGDKYAQFTAILIDNKNAFLQWLDTVAGPVVQAMVDGAVLSDNYNQALETGVITLAEYQNKLALVSAEMMTAAEAQAFLDSKQVISDGLLGAITAKNVGYNQVLMNTIKSTEDLADETEDLGRSFEDLNVDVADSITAIDDLRRANEEDVFGGLDTDPSSRILGAVEAIDFKEAGGEGANTLIDAINRGVADGKITEPQARELFQAVYTEAQGIEVELGNIDLTTAAQNISDEFGTPFEDAKQDLLDYQTGVDLISYESILRDTGQWKENTVASLQKAELLTIELGKMPAVYEPINEGAGTLAGTLADAATSAGSILALDGKTINTTLNFTVLGLLGLDDIVDSEHAAGGPIRAGELSLVGEEGPELFRPNTSGQIISNPNSKALLAGGGGGPPFGGDGTQSIIFESGAIVINDRESGRELQDMLGKLFRGEA